MGRIVTIGQQQNIIDIALQEYGDAGAVFLLMDDNPAVVTGLNVELAPGTRLSIVSEPVNAAQVEYFQRNNIRIASGTVYTDGDGFFLTTEDGETILSEGQTPIKVEESEITTEDGNTITTEDGDDITN